MKLLLTVFFVSIFSMTIFCQTVSNKKDLSNAQLNKKLVDDFLLKNKNLSELLTKTIDGVPGTTDKIDTSLKVIYQEKENDTKRPAIYLNDKFISVTLLSTLNPFLIESLNCLNEKIQIDSVQYFGEILIRTKNNYNPQIISLRELKEKYTNLKDKSSIFMVDRIIINEESDKYFVDENNLLRIIIESVQNAKENIDLGLIKILTKSEVNINELKKIRIRGME